MTVLDTKSVAGALAGPARRLPFDAGYLLLAIALLLYPAVASPFFIFQIGGYTLILGTIALSLMVLAGYAGPSRGHVAVVRRAVGPREIRVDHANWLDDGAVYVNDPVADVSLLQRKERLVAILKAGAVHKLDHAALARRKPRAAE